GQSLTPYIVGLTKKALNYETVTDYVGTVMLESHVVYPKGQREMRVAIWCNLGSDPKDINCLLTAVFTGKLDEGDEVGEKTSHSMRRPGVRLLADANVRLEAIADYGRCKV
ncbi:hypothetical protein FOZ62_029450, partial [Perkinsus olseni]